MKSWRNCGKLAVKAASLNACREVIVIEGNGVGISLTAER